MTKLTPQEIEKEREMFERRAGGWIENEFMKKYRDYPNDYALPNEPEHIYIDSQVQMIFEGWLARAELAKGGK